VRLENAFIEYLWPLAVPALKVGVESATKKDEKNACSSSLGYDVSKDRNRQGCLQAAKHKVSDQSPEYPTQLTLLAPQN
jgi:hypothetical protein